MDTEISKYIDDLKNATQGADLRNAICNCLKQAYIDTKNPNVDLYIRDEVETLLTETANLQTSSAFHYEPSYFTIGDEGVLIGSPTIPFRISSDCTYAIAYIDLEKPVYIPSDVSEYGVNLYTEDGFIWALDTMNGIYAPSVPNPNTGDPYKDTNLKTLYQQFGNPFTGQSVDLVRAYPTIDGSTRYYRSLAIKLDLDFTIPTHTILPEEPFYQFYIDYKSINMNIVSYD